MARDNGVDEERLLNELSDIRVVSNVTMRAILDLMDETVKNNIDVNFKYDEEKNLFIDDSVVEIVGMAGPSSKKAERFKDILDQFLDTAIKMTGVECGSVMVVNEAGKDMQIRSSYGLDESRVRDVRVNIGEGIAGLAAKSRSSFLIGQDSDDTRINHLLKRPEIKQALVMPIVVRNRVFGVLNLHTKKEGTHLDGSMKNLQLLSNLLSAVL
jgi:transcriptional regulator with GAF, ATPase, and Fis domain